MTVTVTTLAPAKIVYTDLNREYAPGFKSALVYNVTVVELEIMNLFTTLIGEVEFEPELGSTLPGRLFDPRDDTTAFALEHDLYLALNRWMSERIYIRQEDIVVDYAQDWRGFKVYLTYVLIGLGVSVESTLKLER